MVRVITSIMSNNIITHSARDYEGKLQEIQYLEDPYNNYLM